LKNWLGFCALRIGLYLQKTPLRGTDHFALRQLGQKATIRGTDSFAFHTQIKTYIGIDIAKLHLDIHCNDKVVRILNNEKSITVFLKSLPEHSIIVCESSGGYEASLISLAHTLHCSIARINARQVRDFAKAKGRLAKSDASDAQILTEFGQAFHPDPLSVSEPLHQQLAVLVKLRSHLLTQITQNNNLTETISDKLILAIIEKTVSSLKKQADNLRHPDLAGKRMT
jgi:transposase